MEQIDIQQFEKELLDVLMAGLAADEALKKARTKQTKKRATSTKKATKAKPKRVVETA